MDKLKKLLNSDAMLLGLAIGLVFQAFVLPDGGDCIRYFCVPYTVLTRIPAWGHLLLWPVTLLPIRFGWAIFVALLAMGLIALGKTCMHPNWVIALCLASPISFSEVWLGQIGFFTVWGLVLVAQGFRRRNHWWSGLGVALLSIKPQVVWVFLLCLLVWVWQDRQLIQLFVPSIVLGLLSLVMYGWWVGLWLGRSYLMFGTSLIWPYCLLLLPLIFLPTKTRREKAVLALGLSLACSPYVYTYHSMSLATIIPPLQIVGWILAFLLKFPDFDYAGFVIPVIFIAGWVAYYVIDKWLDRFFLRSKPVIDGS